ncbi:tetratricopeptide repeat protein [bacterium]|nr:tetratricopeptide repeat protein [bacterium]
MHLKRICIIIGCLFLIAGWLAADSPQNFFEQGNQYYIQGEFENALMAYQEIVKLGYESGPLYFNIGNCYYKLGNIGQAILHYERSKKFMPSDEDLKANLAIAQLSVVDQVKPASDFIVIRLTHAFFHILPKTLQLVFTLSAYFLFTAILFFFLLTRSSFWQQITYRLLWILGIVLFLLIISFTGRLFTEHRVVEAVILAERVDVMSAPVEQGGVEVFSLHEGTKVRLDRSSDNWVEIVLPDRKVGWVKQDVLETI